MRNDTIFYSFYSRDREREKKVVRWIKRFVRIISINDHTKQNYLHVYFIFELKNIFYSTNSFPVSVILYISHEKNLFLYKYVISEESIRKRH